MKIVTDNGVDFGAAQSDDLDIHIVPLTIHFGDQSYRGGVDIQSDEFYRMLRSADHLFPTTSQPSPADFHEIYKQYGSTQVLSIHMSKELSGTYNAARLGAEMAAEDGADITVIDSRTISGALGWQVESAARAADAGWTSENIVKLIEKIGKATAVVCSPETLKYLVHGGRVSHIQGFAATMLNIKPILKLDHHSGKLERVSTVRTMKKALLKHVDIIAEEHGEGTPMRLQICHGDNEADAAAVREQLEKRFECHWKPAINLTPLVGAHAGPGMVGVIYAPEHVFDEVPV